MADEQEQESAPVTDLTKRRPYFADPANAKAAAAKAVEVRREKALTRRERTEAEKRRERDIRKHVTEMSKIEVYHQYLTELQDNRPLKDWAEAAARKVLGGILDGSIEVKGSNAANVLDSVFKIIQLTQGKPTSIDGTLSPEERREALAELHKKIAERTA